MPAMLGGLLRLPAFLINGLTVSLGVGLSQLVVALIGPPGAVQAATAGAIYASLPHLVDRPGRAARRALAGGAIGSATALAIIWLEVTPLLTNLGIAALVFAAMMTMAWGPRAGPIAFTVVLAIVFSLASRAPLPHVELLSWTLGGAAIYAVWALLSTLLLEARYRTLAVAAAIGASARLLRSRAAVLEERTPVEEDATARWRQIDEEAQLAVLLQSARDLVFDGKQRRGRIDHARLLLRAIELRDLLLTSRLDLDLLGSDELAQQIRTRLARSLRVSAAALDSAEAALTSGVRASFERAQAAKEITALLDERDLPADDPRLRLLPALGSRQQNLIDLIASIHEQLRGSRHEGPMPGAELGQLATDDDWPLAEVARNLSLQSPVFRHALRSAVALSSAHALSSALPWTAHPHWMVLSVAVVLRGTFAQTVSRRNERILGTAGGCLLALGLASFAPEAAIVPIFLLAVGAAHAFVNVRYTLTATAATVTALLQTRTMAFVTPVVLIERLGDTVLGAGFAWAFSYVLPSWSRRSLPAAVENTLRALASYAGTTLSMIPDTLSGRSIARERAYAALDTLISTVRLGNVEPERVRPPLPALVSFIDHAQSLMAHLSSLRLLLARRAQQLQGSEADRALGEARPRIEKRLELDAAPYSISPQAQPLHIELPSVPADSAAYPWLVRRLNVSIYEADRTGQAGRAALSLLRQ
jgi:uncharacterized membrane protein YccC